MFGTRGWVVVSLTCAFVYTSGCGGDAFSGTATEKGGDAGESQGNDTGGAGRGSDDGGQPGEGGSPGHAGSAVSGGSGGSKGGSKTGGSSGMGGSGGRGGSAGSNVGGSNAGSGGGMTVGDCNSDAPGPKLVAVPSTNGAQYCVDSTEVTAAHYQAFLAANPPTNGQPAYCSWNASYTPTGNWPPGAAGLSYPVTFVDWCDARAYCAWAGKRLCGNIGGGSSAVADVADASKSQWYRACSAGGDRAYPYGADYSGTKCNGADYPSPDTVRPVGSIDACVGGYSELYDMSGNVWEWVDSCSGQAGQNDICLARGGAYDSPAAALRCDHQQSFYRSAAGVSDGYVGFRCCAL